MQSKIGAFKRGKTRRRLSEGKNLSCRKRRARTKAQETGNWTEYKALSQELMSCPATDPQDAGYRRMFYVRYADDFLVGISGSKADAIELKAWMMEYLRAELDLELSLEKTLITNARKRVRFLGYDIVRWGSERHLKVRSKGKVNIKRTTTYKLTLRIPKDKCMAYARMYGNPQGWQGMRRPSLLNKSELEILMLYNAEIRGFLGYYALADDLTSIGSSLLWMTTASFLRTLASKRQSTLCKVARSLKAGPNRYVIDYERKDGRISQYVLVSSTKQLRKRAITYTDPDLVPNAWQFRRRTELGRRLRRNACEWCGSTDSSIEVHHVRNLIHLKGSELWERVMTQKRRKTLVLCKSCHENLHADRLAQQHAKGKSESRILGNG